MAQQLTPKVLAARIQERMTALGTNAFQTSKRAGLGETFVSDIVNQRNQKPSLGPVLALAKVLECDLAYLVGDQDLPRRAATEIAVAEVPIIGVAEAGAFRVMADEDQSPHNLRLVSVRKSRRYPMVRHFALEVRGDSMNAARPSPILDGAVALCVDILDAGLEIETDKIYAARRTLDDGQTWECTIKRARVFRDRYELVPESTNPVHKPLIIPRGAGRDHDSHRIEAIGLVYAIQYDYEDL